MDNFDLKKFLVENKLTSNSRLNEEKLHATPQELIRSLPQDLKKLLFDQWNAKQNPQWHPEGNTLKHILVVIKRAYHHYPNDPNMIMAALFHDLGKMDTYAINPKTNQPTAYGHEEASTKYVDQFKSWIESFDGTDVEEIKYLVKNHMKIKPSTWDQMKDTKKEPIQTNPAFNKLQGFTDKLDGGGTNMQEQTITSAVVENFNLKKFLVENKLTTNSKLLTEEANDPEMDAAMKAGLSALSSAGASLEEIPEEEQPKQLNESVVGIVASGLLAAPKIIMWMAKPIAVIAKFFTKDKDENAIAKKISHFAHKWEHLYIKAIIFIVKKTKFVKDIWMKADGSIDQQKLLIVAKYIYAGILAVAVGNALGTVLGTSSPVLKGLEATLGGIKVVEIKEISEKVKGQLKGAN